MTHENQNQQKIKTPRSAAARHRVRAFLAGLLVLLLLLAVNVGMQFIPNSVAKRSMTADNITSVSEKTLSYVRSLAKDKEVVIYWLCEGGVTDPQFEIFLSRYGDANSCIRVSVIDPLLDEDISSAYKEGGINNYSILVQSDLRSTLVDSSEFYVYTSDFLNQMYQTTVYLTYAEMESFYGQYIQTYESVPSGAISAHFQGERKLTSAIDYVVAETVPHGYLLEGHSTDSMPTLLKQLMENGYGLTLDPLTLDGQDIPADANCITLYAPVTDLTEEEYDQLNAYLDRGGSLLLLTDPATVTLELCPRIARLGERFGLTGLPGVVTDSKEGCMKESSEDNSLHTLIPQINTLQAVGADLGRNGIVAHLPHTHGIAIRTELPLGVTAASILTTSSQGNRLSPEGETLLEKNEIIPVAVAATQNVVQGDGSTATAKLIWFGSTQFLAEDVAAGTYYGNYYCIISSVDQISQSFSSPFEKITPMSVSVPRMEKLGQTAAILWSVVAVAIIPLGCLFAGIAVWTKRRHR